MIAAIINPTSANGKIGREWPAMRERLEREVGPLEAFLTEGRGHAISLTRRAVKMGAATILSIGGDGTLHEVVNGCFEHGELIHPAASIAVLLRGTGGDFARTLPEFPRTLPALIQALKSIQPQPCDVIRMQMTPLNADRAERYFINLADVGVGGQLADAVNASPKILGGPLTFFLAGLWISLFRYHNAPLHIELDGQVISAGARHYFAAIANGTHFGGGMHIAPDANYQDGLFDVVLVGNLTLPEKFYFAYKLYQGQAGQLRKVRIIRGRHLRITSPEKVFIEADGELVGQTDATFDILPGAINVFGL